MVANILKYGSNNLIMLYHCTYSELLGTMEVVIWSSMELMRNAGFGP